MIWEKIQSENFKHQYWHFNYDKFSRTIKETETEKNENELLKEIEKNLRKGIEKNGYKKYNLVMNDGKSKSIRAHRLFYQEYNKENLLGCGICGKDPSIFNMFESRHEIDHINGIRLDNNPENLQRLCKSCHSKKTRKESTNLERPTNKYKIVAYKENDDNFLQEFDSINEIIEILGFNDSSIRVNRNYNDNNVIKKFIGTKKHNDKYRFESPQYITYDEEIWKDIPNSSKKLNKHAISQPMQISNYGRIRDNAKRVKVINEYYEGYLRIKINKKLYGVHFLVLLVFKYEEFIKKAQEQKTIYDECKDMSTDEIINSYNKRYSIIVDHIDHDRSNNCLTNLRCVNITENNRNKSNSRKICQYSLDNKLLKVFNTMTDASTESNTSQSSISRVCNKKRNRNTAGGFIWRYEE